MKLCKKRINDSKRNKNMFFKPYLTIKQSSSFFTNTGSKLEKKILNFYDVSFMLVKFKLKAKVYRILSDKPTWRRRIYKK